MARDLDFRRPTSLQTNTPRVKNTSPLPSPKKRSSWPITLLIILGFILLLIGLYWQFLRPSPVSQQIKENPIKGQTVTPSTTQSTQENKNIFAASGGPRIQIYNSGGGDSALNAVIKKIEAADYNVENLDKSQFEYDKTYIWYHAENLDLAKKISNLLEGRTIILKESKTYGLFDILIWLGKS